MWVIFFHNPFSEAAQERSQIHVDSNLLLLFEMDIRLFGWSNAAGLKTDSLVNENRVPGTGRRQTYNQKDRAEVGGGG